MSEENVETYLRADAAFNRGDLDRWLEFFDPEIEWHDLPTLPGAGVHHGTEELVQRVDDLQETLGDFRTEVEEIRSVGDRVVARLRYTGAERVSDVPTTALTVSHLVEFRDGRIFRSRLFADDADALKAAGLSE